MKRTGYRWWVARVRAALRMVDVVRVDHFRGFEAAWQVPGGDATAQRGRWVKGPGAELFDKLRAALGPLPIIAEDLGVITPRVDDLRERFGLSGMKVLQFAFGGDAFNPYLPHNQTKNSVVYTGTHDNDTSLGWYARVDEKTRDHVRRYLWSDGKDVHLDMIRFALMSHADVAIAPLQDVLGLGGEARFNTPGAAEGNWQWRVREDQLTRDIAVNLRYLTELYGRGPLPPEEPEDDDFPDPDEAADE